MDDSQKSYSRREFLSTGLAGLVAGGILEPVGKALAQYHDEKPIPAGGKEVIYRTLGKTGIKLPIVSMGVMNASVPELVRKSYEIGIRHFDTAAYYQGGKNEEMVGEVLRELKARDNVVIGTKVYIPHEQRGMPVNEAKQFYLKTAEESLKRLQTDHIDILYSHNVVNVEYINNPGIREALQSLKDQGKARFIGFSVHNSMAGIIREAVRDSFWDVILTTFNFALSDDEQLKEALRSAASKGIGLIAMKTQSSQDWYRAHLPESMQQMYAGTLVQTAVLKWALRHPFITTAIPGFTTFQQIDEDFPVAYDLEYTTEERKFLTDKNVKLSQAYCRQCYDCVQRCPQGVDIPTLMRVHMYATCYRNLSHARQTIDDIPRDKSLLKCSKCDTCKVQCNRGIEVAHRIGELKSIYG